MHIHGSIPASASYQRYSGHPFVSPIYSRIALKRFTEKSIIPKITTGDFLGEMPDYGGTIVFRIPPRATVRRSTLGGIIQHDQYAPAFRSMTVGGALEASHTIDSLDELMMSGQWGSFLAEINQSTMDQYDQTMQNELLNILPARIQTEGNPAMFGAKAGAITHAYNLGKKGAPVTLTSANILTILTYVRGVAREANLPVDSERMFIIMPSIAETLILNSELRDASFRGGNDKSMLEMGRPLVSVGNIDIYVNNNCPQVFDGAVNSTVFQCMFGFSWAIAAASRIVQERVLRDASPESWMAYYQSRLVYTQGVLYPEALGLLQARFA